MIWLDDRPLADVVYSALDLTGWRDAVLVDRPLNWYPNATGAQRGTTGTVAGREVSITVDIRPPVLVDRAAALDALYAACDGVRRLRVADDPTRDLVVEFRGATFRDYGGGALAHPGGVAELRFRALSLWMAREATVLAPIGTTPVPLPLGTAPSPYRLSIMGAATNPVVTLRAPSGRVLETLTLTGTIAATERLECTSDGTLTLVTSAGVRTSVQTWRTGGDVPALDPNEGAVSLTVSSGTGVLVLLPQYRS